MWTELISTPLFGLALTACAYALAVRLFHRFPVQWLNPLVVAATLIMLLLYVTDTPVEQYQKGGDLITFWLGPAVVALAVPLHRQMQAWRQSLAAMLIATAAGCLAGVTVAPLVAFFCGVDRTLVRALVPRSVTTPIAVELAQVIGALPEVTAGLVIITGILGHVFGPRFLTRCGVRNAVARGLAVGVAAHGIGTARMLRESEVEGAAGSLGMALAGLLTGVAVGLLAGLISI